MSGVVWLVPSRGTDYLLPPFVVRQAERHVTAGEKGDVRIAEVMEVAGWALI